MFGTNDRSWFFAMLEHVLHAQLASAGLEDLRILDKLLVDFFPSSIEFDVVKVFPEMFLKSVNVNSFLFLSSGS